MRKQRTSKRRVGRRRGLNRRRLYNPRPIFTETYKAKELTFDISGSGYQGVGFTFAATMDGLPQLSQYSNLYQKYKIMKAEWLLLPNWTGGEKQNEAIYNAASGPSVPPGLTSVGTTRIVYAINDTPNQSNPTSEQEVLVDNGCKIKFLDKLVKIRNRPCVNTQDALGNFITLKNKFINFAPLGLEMPLISVLTAGSSSLYRLGL